MKTNVPVRQGAPAPAPRTFSPFQNLRTEVDRLFEDFTSGFGFGGWPEFRTTALTPMMDVTETDKELEVTAELPGLEEKDVDITLADGVLTIRGEKKSDHEEKGKDYRMVERSYGAFARSLQLPAGVDPNTIKASLDKGVLKVSIPKRMADVKKIHVKAAA
jgi:HSP20 family protein